MSRRSTQSLAKSKAHSDSPSQKLAKAKPPQTAQGMVAALDAHGAALEAAAAKAAANEAIANANRLEKIAMDSLKKASLPDPLTIPTRTGPKPPKAVATSSATRKRKPTATAKTDKPAKRNSGPFFDASLANPPPPKRAAVGESLNKGYLPCAFYSNVRVLSNTPFCVGGPW